MNIQGVAKRQIRWLFYGFGPAPNQ